jgi:hypothetical protein
LKEKYALWIIWFAAVFVSGGINVVFALLKKLFA